MSIGGRLLKGPDPEDILVNDMVRADGLPGVWWVKEITGDHATIATDADHRAIMPMVTLHRLKQRGSLYDTRSLA